MPGPAAALREFVADLCSWRRFRRAARQTAEFRPLCEPARWRWRYDPRLSTHVDDVAWATRRESGLWLVGERFWSGWPDPPEWAFWAIGADGAIEAAWDFDDWPAGWRKADAASCGERDDG